VPPPEENGQDKGLAQAEPVSSSGDSADAVASGAPDVMGATGVGPQTRRSLTIGSVCKLLKDEFPDISISKIRYLEDQKLLSPRRTQGGYRLYAPSDVGRLRTILRLQRDQFMPLRVIRRELAAGRAGREEPEPAAEPERQGRGRAQISPPTGDGYELDELSHYTGVEERQIRELQDFGVIKGMRRDGPRRYDDLEREIVRTVAELTRYGVAPRNLRVFRTSVDREAALLEQILGPALRSRNSERRGEAIEALENLAAVVSHLKHLLLVRDLRDLVQ
jgi:DNA-binding transcriptional MerR regulator